MNIAATSSAVMVSLQGMNRAILVQSWSVIVSMESNPCDSGSLTIKSIAMVSNGAALGVGEMGYNGALVGLVFTL